MPIFINKTKINNVSGDSMSSGTNINADTGRPMNLHDISHHIYDDDEIKSWRMDEAIKNSPISRKPLNMRSKMAYREIMTTLKPTKKYLLPGEMCVFNYAAPKTAADLEYYDATPFVLFFGITRMADGNIREIGFNLHYYPPLVRKTILNTVYEVFKSYYIKYFNDQPHKANTYVNYNVLKMMLRNSKIKFGLRMYVPSLRGSTWTLPTKMIPVAAITEGHFNGATYSNIQRFWRRAKRQ